MRNLQNKIKYVWNFFLAGGVVATVALTNAFALTPSLSLSSQSGTTYGLNVSGDPNQTIFLFYHANSNPSFYTSLNIGTTNASGTYAYAFNTNTYNVVANDAIYVSVNGQNSSTLQLNNPSGSTATGTISLSQNSISLNTLQQGSILAYNISSNLNATSNNTNVATVSVNGSTIYVNGINSGTANIYVSGTNTSGQYVYGNIVVTVTGNSVNPITFSQNNITVAIGQQATTFAYNMAGNMSVSSSNTNVATTYVSGSTIYVTGVAQGTATISVNGTNTYGQNATGTLYVTVNSNSTSGNLSLSQTNLTLSPQQSKQVTAYNVYGNLSVISQNTNIATATVSGNTITVTGINPGPTYINVTGTNYNGQSVTNSIRVTVNGNSSNPGTGPWTVNVCGYSGNTWTCQNITVNDYNLYLYLQKYNQNNGWNGKYPNKWRNKRVQNIQKRIEQINKQMQKRMEEMNKRMQEINNMNNRWNDR